MNVIGKRIRCLREVKNLTQAELAARCNLLEWDLSRGTLAKIESNVRKVTDKEAVLLARALDVAIEEVFSEL